MIDIYIFFKIQPFKSTYHVGFWAILAVIFAVISKKYDIFLYNIFWSLYVVYIITC